MPSSDDPSRGTFLLSYAENEDYMPECNEVPNEDNTDPARISTGSPAWTTSWAAASIRPALSLRGTPGHRQDDACAAVSPGRRSKWASEVLYITLSEKRAGAASSRGATAGRWTASTFSSWCRRKPASDPEQRADAVSSRRDGAERDDQADFRSGARDQTRHAWCSTAFPKCGCWRRARCATAGRSWR